MLECWQRWRSVSIRRINACPFSPLVQALDTLSRLSTVSGSLEVFLSYLTLLLCNPVAAVPASASSVIRTFEREKERRESTTHGGPSASILEGVHLRLLPS